MTDIRLLGASRSATTLCAIHFHPKARTEGAIELDMILNRSLNLIKKEGMQGGEAEFVSMFVGFLQEHAKRIQLEHEGQQD